MIEERLRPALLDRAREMIEHDGIEGLMTYRYRPMACGCVGPQDGEPLCGCAMRWEMERNLMGILQEIAPEAALKLLRTRIVIALSVF
jgi:hypothetical protein